MYKIQYQWSNRLPLAYFNDYDLATECLGILKKRYPSAIIELIPVHPITTEKEFINQTDGKIAYYESDSHTEKQN